MGKYLKKFETQADYTEAQSSLILPNVSFITENNKVAYNPYVDPYAGHEYVDLGLTSGTLWATMNVGANSVTDYGNYYQFGKGADDYSVTSGVTDYEYEGTENPLAASADTAVQVWGGRWHMPTRDQLEELTANTTYEWTTIDGVNGGKFTAQNGNYVFFPANGHYNRWGSITTGNTGYYWSSYSAGSGSRCYLWCENGSRAYSYEYSYNGCAVRPVVG